MNKQIQGGQNQTIDNDGEINLSLFLNLGHSLLLDLLLLLSK